MKRLLALMLFAVSLGAQAQITYPYNPDSDSNGALGLNDLLDFLTLYGETFEVEEHLCGNPIEHQDEIYQTTYIDGHCWFGENLRATSFTTGEEIPLVTSQNGVSQQDVWEQEVLVNQQVVRSYPAQNNGADFVSELGYLYSGYAAIDARGLCPTGWGIPTKLQYQSLRLRLGGSIFSGLALREEPWGYNSVGFEAKQGVVRQSDGDFVGETMFWTKTTSGSNALWNMRIPSDGNSVDIDVNGRAMGLYVRCIKDSE